MRLTRTTLVLAATLTALTALAPIAQAKKTSVQLGPRPFYLVETMTDGDLKERLQECAAKTKKYEHRDFSIGHRGAALQFPEHTLESYQAADRMGAGIIECDVTFTADGELVCRHAQCDLQTTTNILATPLAAKCSTPFTPAVFDAMGKLVTPATARCCSSALTLDEFKSLEGKMDAADASATTVEQFLGGTADFRTDLYATGGTLMSHAESIELIDGMRAKFTPELKSVTDGFGSSGLTQESYARKMIHEYIAAGIDPRRVYAQSFDINDVLQWIDEFPDFGKQAVFLDARNPSALSATPPPLSEFMDLKADGVNIVAPPMPALLKLDGGNIVPSGYATRARAAGLDIISWTLERSGRIVEDVIAPGSSFYFQTTLDALENDGDILRTVDVLARDVGIIGLFSDWPATVSFYANCMLDKKGKVKGKHKHKNKNKKHHDDDDDDDD